MKRRYTRRDFVKYGLKSGLIGGLGASVLPSCAAMDRFFGLEKSTFEKEVLIIGGGAAGLSAAYYLKKAGIPYRLFESSPRIGGRVYSLENFNEDHQVAELGAEYFEANHQLIFDLCKELNLPIDEVSWDKKLERQLTFSRGKILTSKELAAKFQKLSTELVKTKLSVVGDQNEPLHRFNIENYPKASPLDQMSVKDLLVRMSNKIDAETIKLFESSCVAQFGAEIHKISALHLINSIDLEESPNKSLYKVRYGNQRLLRTLYERISGVLPDFFVRLDSRLFEISESGGYFQCYFRTPQGTRKFQARYVILAIPANQYHSIDGLRDLQIDSDRRQSIGRLSLAAHAKVVLGYKNRFWLSSQGSLPSSRGAFFKDTLPQVTWDGSQSQEGDRGILSVLVGGEKAEKMIATYPETVIQEMQVFSRSFRSEYENINHIMNWKHRFGIEGSFIVYGPGDFIKYHGVWAEPDYGGRLCYAGEHCHLSRYGTWVGALETGYKAARNIIELQEKEAYQTI